MGKKSSGRGCKMATGGMVPQQSWQEKLAEVRAKVPKQTIAQTANYADGGVPMDEQINRFASGIQSAPSVLGVSNPTAGVGPFSGPGAGAPALSGLAGAAAAAPTTSDQQAPVAQTTAAVTPQTASMGNPFRFGAGSSVPLTDFNPLTDFAPLVSQQIGRPKTSAQPVDALLPGQAAPSMDAFSPTKKKMVAQGFADGGKVDPVEELLRRTQQKYGTAPTPAPVPDPTQQRQAQQAATQSPSGMSGVISTVRNRQQELDKVTKYADGGAIDPTEKLLRDMAAKYGTGKPADPVPASPQQRPAQQATAPSSQAQNAGSLPVTDKIKYRQQELDKVMRYADGGMVRFAGKGGPREDKIPVKVAGQSINVSDGENAVILPAKTAANPQAVQAIGQIIQQSNDGRAPKGGMVDGGKYAVGAYPYTDDPVPTLQQVYAPVDARGVAAQAFPSTMAAIQQHGDAAQQAAASGNYGGALGHVARGGIAGTVGVADDVMRSAAYALDPAANALKTFVTGDSAPINNPRQGPAKIQQATFSNEGRPSAVQSAGMAAQAIANAPDPRIAATTGNAGDAEFFPNNGRLSFVDKGLDVQRQQLADGTGLMHRPRDGKTILFANMDPNQYVGADGTPNQPWEKTAQYQQAIAQNQKDKDNLASLRAENAYQDSTSENRYQRDMGARQMQAIGATQGLAGQALAQAGQRQAVAANAPATAQQLAQQQVGMGGMALKNAQELSALYEAHQKAATPEERELLAETIRARTGKDRPEEFAHAAGGTTINPATMGVEKTPDVIYSKRTGQAQGAHAAATPSYSVNVGMPVQAPDGTHTFQGKLITVKSGKVVEVK